MIRLREFYSGLSKPSMSHYRSVVPSGESLLVSVVGS